jgi:hypothetical protein
MSSNQNCQGCAYFTRRVLDLESECDRLHRETRDLKRSVDWWFFLFALADTWILWSALSARRPAKP